MFAVNCVNRACRAYYPRLRERLDAAVGRWVSSHGWVDPKFNGARVSRIAAWLKARKP